MGDRCDLWLTYRRPDEARLAAVLGRDWYSAVEAEGLTWRTAYIEQANYALSDERELLAERKLCFLGHHDAGDEYPAARFAACGGEQAEAPAGEDGLAVVLDERGEVEPESLRLAKSYLALAARAREYLGVRPPAEDPTEYCQLARVRGAAGPVLFADRIEPDEPALRAALVAHLGAEPYRDGDGFFYVRVRNGRLLGLDSFAADALDAIREEAERKNANGKKQRGGRHAR